MFGIFISSLITHQLGMISKEKYDKRIEEPFNSKSSAFT